MVTAVTPRDTCPSEEALLDCLAEQRVGELAEHLDACPLCREVIAELARGSSDAPPGVQARPHMIGRFEVQDQLGIGAMGVVYLARDPRLQRQVALKVIRGDREARTAHRLIDEARALARLEHDNLVAVYDVEEIGEEVAIAMAYLPGGTLRAWLTGPRPWREIATVMRDVARGLAAIHRAGLVHRDLKPDNILFDANGRPRIADLGLATLAQAPGPSGLVGTPAYMAPELLDGAAASERTDQWSFFVCLYEALGGRRPFAGATPTALRAAMRSPRGSVAGPRTLQGIVARGLQVDPAARHASMTAVADALARLLGQRVRRVMLGASAGLVVVAGLLVAFAARTDPPCGGADEALAAVWNPSVSARLSGTFDRNGMAGTGRIFTQGLDHYASSWISMHEASCRATHVRGEQSEAMLDRRTLCLRERLAQVDALVGALGAADRPTLSRAGEAVALLQPVADCGDLVALTAATALPAGPAERARISIARLELAKANALRPLGQSSAIIERVETIIATAVDLRDHALEAEGRLVMADALAEDLQLALAHKRFAETELAAEAAGSDDLRARTLIAHASLVGALQQDPASGAELLSRARAVILRLGARPDLDRRVLVADAALALARGDREAGERALRAALASLPTTGPEAVMRVTALRDLANVLGETGRQEEAVVIAREAVALGESTLGPDHVDVAEVLSTLSLALHYVDKDPEARLLAARALRIKARARGPDHVSLSSTMMVLAEIERDSRQPGSHAEARRLTDRAISLRLRAYGAANPLVLTLMSERGSLAVDAGEYMIARANFTAAVSGLERAWGAASPAVTQARASMATMSERTGDPAGCAARLAEVATAIAAAEGRTSPRLIAVGVQRSHCLILARSFELAAAEIATTAALELSADERSSLDVVAARLALELGNPDRAHAIAEEVERRLAATPAEADSAQDLDLDLGALWVQLRNPERAWLLAQRATAAVGTDLEAGELLARGAQIALELRRDPDAAALADRAIAIATESSAGPDTLSRYRGLAAKARSAPRGGGDDRVRVRQYIERSGAGAPE